MIDLYSDLSSSSIDPLASRGSPYADAVAERERERVIVAAASTS